MYSHIIPHKSHIINPINHSHINPPRFAPCCPRRESLAEDLRRLAEEKRRVRREEQEEVQRGCRVQRRGGRLKPSPKGMSKI